MTSFQIIDNVQDNDNRQEVQIKRESRVQKVQNLSERIRVFWGSIHLNYVFQTVHGPNYRTYFSFLTLSI